jgi:hypothetical protein
MITTGTTPGPRPQRLNVSNYARFVRLAFQGARALGRLLRIRHELPDNPFERIMDAALLTTEYPMSFPRKTPHRDRDRSVARAQDGADLAACPGRASRVQCTQPGTQVLTLPSLATHLRAKGRFMLDFGPDLCSDPTFSTEREWLVTDGLGGYASGTVAGSLTRHDGRRSPTEPALVTTAEASTSARAPQVAETHRSSRRPQSSARVWTVADVFRVWEETTRRGSSSIWKGWRQLCTPTCSFTMQGRQTLESTGHCRPEG